MSLQIRVDAEAWDRCSRASFSPRVQQDQYVFLNQCVLDIIRSHRDSKVDLIYQNTTAMTIYENLAPVTTFGQTNGYIA